MKILFIGNRFNVLKELLKYQYNITTFALNDSLLEEELKKKNISYNGFDIYSKKIVLNIINHGEYDVLISNGCPFIIPINDSIKNKILINIHPTFLPELRGKTPLNGVFYNEIPHLGATMHFLSNKIDEGNIVYQEKISITEDIDLGLVYYISFLMEGIVFRRGWELLKKNNFNLIGIPQENKTGFYFNRTSDLMIIDFSKMNNNEINKRIKSFGIKNQGCVAFNLKKISINKIYDIQIIVNPFLLDFFNQYEAGDVLLDYDGKYLVKTIDGLIKIIRYE